MDFQIVELEEGRAVFAVDPAEYHYNPIGVVHGGLAATLLDSAMGCAVHSMLPAGSGYTTLELKVNFIRALTAETGRVRAEGKLIHLGGRTATAEGRVIDESGKLYAHATTTCLILVVGRVLIGQALQNARQLHSNRRATSGSTLVARRAGMQQAIKATTMSPRATVT